MAMIEQIHQQIMQELERTASSDTILVIGTVIFNFVAMVICWGMAGESYKPLFSDVGETAIFFLLLFAVAIFTATALQSMLNSEAICKEYKAALRKMYEEHGVDKYLPKSMSVEAGSSNMLRKAFVLLSGILAVAVPLIDEFL